MLRREWSFFQDETKLELNPRVGFCWMRKGKQKKLPTQKDLPFPTAVGAGGGQRREPHQQAGEGVRGRLRWAAAFASAAGMESAEQPGGVGLWWSLHEAISRNHNCEDLDELLEFAESYLQERQPFDIGLGEDYKRLERTLP